jgi:hypothetical protein
MIIDHKDATAVITQEKTTLKEFSKKLSLLYERFKSDDIIVHLNDTTTADVHFISPLASKHLTAKRCFIVVSSELNPDDFNDLIIVPTVQEAHDFIKMEVIQRDLGL